MVHSSCAPNASPSSSWPRTTAFHAVDRGSNPLGDANTNSGTYRNVGAFFVVVYMDGYKTLRTKAIVLGPADDGDAWVVREKLRTGLGMRFGLG